MFATDVFNDEILDVMFVFTPVCDDNDKFIVLMFVLIVDIFEPIRFISPSCEANVRFVGVTNDENSYYLNVLSSIVM